jgi:hypothetical protein
LLRRDGDQYENYLVLNDKLISIFVDSSLEDVSNKYPNTNKLIIILTSVVKRTDNPNLNILALIRTVLSIILERNF